MSASNGDQPIILLEVDDYPSASFEARVASGEFEEIADDSHKAGRRFTTARDQG